MREKSKRGIIEALFNLFRGYAMLNFVFPEISLIPFYVPVSHVHAVNVLSRRYKVKRNDHQFLFDTTPQSLIFLCHTKERSSYHTHHRSGKHWDNCYKLHPLDPDGYYVVLRYIERTPVRAGIVADGAALAFVRRRLKRVWSYR